MYDKIARQQQCSYSFGISKSVRGRARVCWGYCCKGSQTGWLKTAEIYCLTTWRLEIPDPGVGWAMMPLKPLRENSAWPSSASAIPRHPLACGRTPPVYTSSLLGRPCWTEGSLCSYGFISTNCLFNDPIFTYGHSEGPGVRTSTYLFSADKIPPNHRKKKKKKRVDNE